jgi:hypothetical protein
MHAFLRSNVEPTISDPKELSAALQQKEEVFKQLFKDQQIYHYCLNTLIYQSWLEI